MIIHIIHYQLAPHITLENFLALTTRVRSEWMQHQAGFISWQQCKNLENGYTDIVTWASAAAAKAAEKTMPQYAQAKAWETCYTDVSYTELQPITG